MLAAPAGAAKLAALAARAPLGQSPRERWTVRAARAAGAAALLGCARGAPAAHGPGLCPPVGPHHCRHRRGVREKRSRLRFEHH